MTTLFTIILNMSITASYIAVAVIAIRLLLKKAPKVFSYALWLAVLIRLVFPVSFYSSISFLSFLQPDAGSNTRVMEYIPYNIGLMQYPAVDVGIGVINQAVNSSLSPALNVASINPIQVYMGIATIIWVLGMFILLLYSLISSVKVNQNLKTATLITKNIFETDRITTPFVYGFIKPKIYVPVGLTTNELSYIVEHEQTHIRRLDYLIKPISFLILIVHWFNPLMWLSFALMGKDMEMSCDESVIRKMGDGVKGNYSTSLLALSVKNRRLLGGSPLAFGESNIKSRIKNILSYKKPTFLVVAAACIITFMFIIGCTANPLEKQVTSVNYIEEQVAPVNQVEELATVWANALMTRDGEPRHTMMSLDMKEKFKQEQINRAGEDWNFNIGVSSPWVVNFEIKVDGETATITYFTKTSEPASYMTVEQLTFGEEDGQLVVTNYTTIYEDQAAVLYRPLE